MSLARATCTPFRAITSRKISPKYRAVFPAALTEKLKASREASIWNMDKVRADRP